MDDVGLPIASAFVSALTECTSTVLSEIAVNTTPDDALLQKEFHLRKIHDNVMAGGEQAAVQRSTAFAVYAHSSERKRAEASSMIMGDGFNKRAKRRASFCFGDEQDVVERIPALFLRKATCCQPILYKLRTLCSQHVLLTGTPVMDQPVQARMQALLFLHDLLILSRREAEAEHVFRHHNANEHVTGQQQAGDGGGDTPATAPPARLGACGAFEVVD